MIIVNKAAKVIFAGEYKFVPLHPVTVLETKSALVKKYPRIGKLFSNGALEVVSAAKGDKMAKEAQEEAKKKIEAYQDAHNDLDEMNDQEETE